MPNYRTNRTVSITAENWCRNFILLKAVIIVLSCTVFDLRFAAESFYRRTICKSVAPLQEKEVELINTCVMIKVYIWGADVISVRPLTAELSLLGRG